MMLLFNPNEENLNESSTQRGTSHCDPETEGETNRLKQLDSNQKTEVGAARVDTAIPIGARLGRYEICSQLGAGGMGEVYLAEDLSLHRKVALKTLPIALASDSDLMRRFEQEAKAAAALNHPNIAHVYEIGEAEGVNFIAMEFVDGQTLRQFIYSGQSDLPKVLRHLQHVAEGLVKAHAAGMVHRDLKPDNIMITNDGHAKILDFGLVKLVGPQRRLQNGGEASESATRIVQHSIPGLILGTVGYMSPEQAKGKTDEIDQRSDIFSFGCVLFEAVTGRKPFEGTDTIDTLNRIIREPVASISQFRPEAPNHLQRIVRRCLAKDPEDRYQTIKDVAIELRELRQELMGSALIDTTPLPETAVTTDRSGVSPTHLPPHTARSTSSSSAEYIVTGVKRHKIAAIILFSVLTLSGIGLAGYLHARNTGSAIDSIAVLPFLNANGDPNSEFLSDGITESIISSLSQMSQLKVMARATVFQYKGKEVDPRKVGHDLGVRAVLIGQLVQQGDNLVLRTELVDATDGTALWDQQYNRKLADIFAVQQDVAKEITERLRLKLTGTERQQLAKRPTENLKAFQDYMQGRSYAQRATRENLLTAVRHYEKALEEDGNYALAYAGLADAYGILGGYGYIAPQEGRRQSQEAARKALALDVNLAEAHAALGLAYTTFAPYQFSLGDGELRHPIELSPMQP